MPFGVNPKTGRPGPAPKPPRDGDKEQARASVTLAVRSGKLPRANEVPCVDCGHVWSEGERRHEYHHHEGYAAKHHLSVVSLCTECHSLRDSEKARQTHCIRGHLFDAENTYRKANGTRACRACRSLHDKKRGPRGSAYWKKVNNKRRGRG